MTCGQRCVDRDGENWLAPRGGHGCRLKEGGGGGLGNGHLCQDLCMVLIVSLFFFSMLCTR